ncbi:MAG: YkoF family thiamine/hydroxymethylpyrimidine-binding protein [Bacteroidota bacterium]
MKISAEISLYPLDAEYNKKVMNFINQINSFEGIEFEYNHMSTLLWGEYDDVMSCLNSSIKSSFEELKSSIVIKISNGCKVE